MINSLATIEKKRLVFSAVGEGRAISELQGACPMALTLDLAE